MELEKKEYLEAKKELFGDDILIEKAIRNYINKEDLSSQILNIQPIYYDKNKIWWCWNKEEFRWELTDETDILNFVNKLSFANTIKSKERMEILEAIKQKSRLVAPKEMSNKWIQFKNKIYDFESGESFNATPQYFATNPIPYEISGDPRTPTFDKIFIEWVGEDYKQTLYEIISYCLLSDYPLHRIFCLVGAGLNGKGSFLNLIEKFIGKNNICSTELDSLISSRFEVTRLHKKLVCIMGETNFSELNKTSMLKKLTGNDLIGFEYKNKNPFEDKNYAKIIIATNNLPATTDKTIGFYRRWMIVDFPNHFSEKKEILKEIPEEEFNNLATKSFINLTKLIEKREFYKEGTIEERKQKYESKSNFLEEFLKLSTTEEVNHYITKADFFRKFTAWCKENRHREMSETSLGLKMKQLGIETGKKEFQWLNDGKGGYARVWLDIKWRE